MTFKKGNIPHNKNKTKENYEPLNVISKKVSETKKRLYKEGKVRAWNKGLTKKNNPDLIVYGCPGDKNPMKRKEVVIKMVNTRMKNNSYLRGKDNPASRPDVIEKIKKAKKGKKYPKISEALRKAYKEGRKNNSLEYSSAWRGGISKEEYGLSWTKELKSKIRKRDNWQCQICNCKNRILDVHHIDYNKKNCDENNLVTLCHNCHCKTNYNRKYWEWQLKLFMNMWNNSNHDINYNIGGSNI